jgi:hypothetical protein
LSINKATLIFTDNNDGGLEVQVLFEPEQVSKESNAHLAAALAHQYITNAIDEAYKNEPN